MTRPSTAVLASAAVRVIPASLVGVLTIIRSELAAIPSKAETDSAGYSRALFPHWITQSGSCDTRETVLGVTASTS